MFFRAEKNNGLQDDKKMITSFMNEIVVGEYTIVICIAIIGSIPVITSIIALVLFFRKR